MSSFHTPDGYRKFYRDESRGITFLAGNDFTTTGLDFIAVKNANYQIFIQKVLVNVSTVAAQTLTFQDDAGTPVVIGVLPASAARGNHIIVDGGAEGIPLTLGTNFEIVASAAGVAGSLIVEGYQRPGQVFAATSGASNQ